MRIVIVDITSWYCIELVWKWSFRDRWRHKADVVRVECVVRYRLTAIVVNNRSHYPTLLDAILFGISRHWWMLTSSLIVWKLLIAESYFVVWNTSIRWMSNLPMPLSSCYWKILIDKKILCQLLQLVVFTILSHRLVKYPGLPWIWISMDKSMDISMDISMCGYQT